MSKRVVVIAKTTGAARAPDGSLVNVQKDITKVMELDNTLSDCLEYAESLSVPMLTLIFETEDPDLRKPKVVKPS